MSSETTSELGRNWRDGRPNTVDDLADGRTSDNRTHRDNLAPFAGAGRAVFKLRRFHHWRESCPSPSEPDARESLAERPDPKWRKPLTFAAAEELLAMKQINVGVELGANVIAVEVFGKDEAEHASRLAAFAAEFGDINDYPTVTGWWGRSLIFMRAPSLSQVVRALDRDGVIIHGPGSVVVIAGCLDNEGRLFSFRDGSPTDFRDWKSAPRALLEAIAGTGVATLDEVDKIVARINQEHFWVSMGGKQFVGFETTNKWGQPTIELLQPETFRGKHAKDELRVEGRNMPQNPADIWWKDHARRSYDGIVCDPSEECGPQFFNTWRDFPIAPKAGEWPLIEHFLCEVLCGGDEAAYEYLLRWLTYKVRNPGALPRVALVFKGDKGCGKGTFAEIMLRLMFGAHWFYADSAEDVFGSFTLDLRDALIVVLDEAVWSGDKRQESRLKTLITAEVRRAGQKYVPVVPYQNMAGIVILTNEDWAVPVSGAERRFFVQSVPSDYVVKAPGISDEERERRQAYWRALHDDGGIERELPAFLYSLLYEAPNPRPPWTDVPETAELARQKALSMSGIDAVIRDAIEMGTLPGQELCTGVGARDWSKGELVILPGRAKEEFVAAIADAMARGSRYHREPSAKSVFQAIERLLDAKVHSTNRGGKWVIPPYAQAARHFSDATGIPVDVDEHEPADAAPAVDHRADALELRRALSDAVDDEILL